MPAHLEPAEFDRRATESTRTRLAHLTVADLDRPATGTDWDVRTLLSHLVGGNLRFAHALRGGSPHWPSRDAEPVTSPLAEFDSSARVMADAVRELPDPRATTLLPAGEPSASFAIAVHAADMLVHGWDVAVATGQDRTLDPELCAAATAVVARYPDSFWGPGAFFAARVETGSTDPTVRLMALVGRDAAAV